MFGPHKILGGQPAQFGLRFGEGANLAASEFDRVFAPLQFLDQQVNEVDGERIEAAAGNLR
jgi:hypothetical protein